MGYMLLFLIPFCAGVVSGYIIPSGSFIKALNQKGFGSLKNSRITQKYPDIKTKSTAEQNMEFIQKRAVVDTTIKPEEIYENGDAKVKAFDVRSFVSLQKKYTLKEKAIHSLLNEQFSDGYDFKRGYYKPSLIDRKLWKSLIPTQNFLTEEELKLLEYFRNSKNDATINSTWKDEEEWPELLVECPHTVLDALPDDYPREFLPQKRGNSQNKLNTKGKPSCKCKVIK